MKIVVLDGHTLNPGDNPWDEVATLGELVVHDRTPLEHVLERAADADVVLTNKTPLTRDTLQQLPLLRFIGVLATGVNVVDLAAARERGIPVSNVPEYGTDEVAQFTFALLLELCHHVAHHHEQVRKGEWKRHQDFCFWETPQVSLAGKTIGVVGFGRIGRRVGELAHAFGMHVLAANRTESESPGYHRFAWSSIPELFAESDVVSLNSTLDTANTGFVDRKLLCRMKPSAFLINTARGALIKEQDLADALRDGTLAGAALDVVSEEPILDDNPLLSAPNCLITPHMAWGSLAARKRLMSIAAGNIRAFLDGRPTNVVGT